MVNDGRGAGLLCHVKTDRRFKSFLSLLSLSLISFDKKVKKELMVLYVLPVNSIKWKHSSLLDCWIELLVPRIRMKI